MSDNQHAADQRSEDHFVFFPRDKVKSWIDFGEGRWRRDILVKAFAIIVQVRPDIYLEQNRLSTKNQFFYYSRLTCQSI